jgi:hypothetical protein
MRRRLASPPPPSPPLLLLATTILLIRVFGIDNGLGVTPPQGWRSWNAYDCTSDDRIITQAHVEAQFAAAVDKSRLVDGVPTSLAQLGFEYISIDDGRVTPLARRPQAQLGASAFSSLRRTDRALSLRCEHADNAPLPLASTCARALAGGSSATAARGSRLTRSFRRATPGRTATKGAVRGTIM